MKNRFFLLFFLFFVPFASATISNYTVPSTIPLNEPLTIYGVSNSATQVLCGFKFFDDSNVLVTRASDEYTFSDGSFTSEYKITEPLFSRGRQYRINTICSTDSANAYFTVTQKQEVAFGVTSGMLISDLEFWTNPENSLTVIFIFFVVLLVVGVFAGIALRAFS